MQASLHSDLFELGNNYHNVMACFLVWEKLAHAGTFSYIVVNFTNLFNEAGARVY